ncbi:MAG: hypothetical protein DRP60_14035, partial [Spirochaetes bacterium]
MTKTGRGRYYRIKPIEGFLNRDVAISAAWMDEYRERVFDQIEDLPVEALNYEAAGTGLTIGRLLLHMAWAETFWIGRISGYKVPADLAAPLAPGSLDHFDKKPEKSPEADTLISLCRRVRDEMTIPGLVAVEDVDAECWEDGSTFRGVLGQLQWHWIYHSGQVGLIRYEWGSDYEWSMGSPMAP